jgi:uncharacterized repeat protein (TIGR04076 family)
MLKRFKVTVEEVRGECRPGYKIGDTFILDGLKTPKEGMCGGAYYGLYPILFLMAFGGRHPQAKGQEKLGFAVCPDDGKVKFRIEIIDE